MTRTMSKSAPKTQQYKVETVLRTQRRVLRLVDSYIGANLPHDALLAADGGIMTWREVRQHIAAAMKLKVERVPGRKRA
jgi:hypothetical protein